MNDGCHRHLPLAFRNPCIHPCPFLRDSRKVELARTLNPERKLAEMDLRLICGKDHGVVTRFSVHQLFDDVETKRIGELTCHVCHCSRSTVRVCPGGSDHFLLR